MRIVILSRKPENAIQCCTSLFENEPTLPRENIIVVDDGAREKAESELPGITWVIGEKPFIFSRNANIGIRHADDDVILMNDDCTLETMNGFSKMCARGRAYGLVAPVVNNNAGGSPEQREQGLKGLKHCHGGLLCFIAVLIPKRIYLKAGPLDERFVRYGYDDYDYCKRVCGLNCGTARWLMIDHDCHIHHHVGYRTFHGPEELNGITHWYDGSNYDAFYEKYPEERKKNL